MDLRTRKWWRPEINSPRSESWHAWSSNSRWIVFASKRRDGLFGRLYFSYVGADGVAHKPFILPQADPAMHDSFLDNFNAPEFVRGPVPVSPKQLDAAAKSDDVQQATGDARDLSELDPLLHGPRDERESLAKLCRAAEQEPRRAEHHYRLAREWEAWNRVDRAVPSYQKAVEAAAESDPLKTEAMTRLAWICASHPAEAVRNGSRALHLVDEVRRTLGDTPEVLALLAAAYAEMCLFRDAVDTARRAEELAEQAGNGASLRRIRLQLGSYQAGEAYRDTFP